MGSLRNDTGARARWSDFPDWVQRRRNALNGHGVRAATIIGWDEEKDELRTSHGIFTGVRSGERIRWRRDSESST